MSRRVTATSRGEWLWAATIVAIAAGLRLPALDIVPPGLHQDEASRLYDSWCLLETGCDRYGARWPAFLRSFGPGDYTAALSTYLTLPAVAILGPTIAAARLAGATLSVLTIVLIWRWLRRETGVAAALASAAALAVCPWHVSLTRTAHESGIVPFFVVAGFWAANRAGILTSSGCRDPHRSTVAWAALSGVMFSLAPWAYPASRLLVPVGLALLIAQQARAWRDACRSRRGRVVLAAFLIGLGIGAAPMISTATHAPERLAARAGATLIGAHESSAGDAIRTFLLHYAREWAPEYLFLRGSDIANCHVPGVGQLLLITAPFLLVGMVQIVATAGRSAWSRFVLGWLLLYAVPVAICRDWSPHPMRAVLGIPVLNVAIGHGVALCGRWIAASAQRRMVYVVAGTLTVANVAHFVRAYFVDYLVFAAPAFRADLPQVFAYTGPIAERYDAVLVRAPANQAYIRMLLFAPMPPQAWLAAPKVSAPWIYGFEQYLRVGPYLFAPHRASPPEAWERYRVLISAIPDGARVLLIDAAANSEGPEPPAIATVHWPNGAVALELFEVRAPLPHWAYGEGPRFQEALGGVPAGR